MNKIIKEKISKGIALLIIVIAFVISLSIMLKYNIEGEKKMPFILKEMLIVSSAEAESKEENPDNNKWNLAVNQYNDIYLEIKKDEDTDKLAYIKNVKIENIEMTEAKKGKLIAYMPSTAEESLFTYEDNLIIQNSLTFNGAEADNSKRLEISNEGGTIMFRVVNKNISEYISNEDDEVAYDGTLLKKTNVEEDEIKFNIKFDLVVTTNSNTYRGTLELELPCGNVSEDGVSKKSITNFEDIIFKREKV